MNRARNNGIYAAETILKQRTKDGKVWYLMKWKGYSPRFNTWEPEENVLDDRLLKAYRKRVAESKGKIRRKRSKPVEDEGNPSDEKAEVDIEGVETTDDTPTTESKQSHDEMPDTSTEQPAESAKKWRKRRKTNTDTLTETDQKKVSETVVDEPSACASVTTETTEIKQNNEICTTSETTACSPEHNMTELSVEIPEDELAIKTMPKSPDLPVLEEAIDSQEQENPPENPIVSCSTNLPVSSETDAPTITVKTALHSPPHVSPKRLQSSDTNTSVFTPEERKIEQKNSQLEKKSIMSKSSHFDFLANSIIITDVTTERGTVTVKECSAYGDFFGPDLEKGH
ncbi:polycomb group protein Pc-like [Actinia tenebrosa]|uniref:Polycomb group protein Pc-like n=1 Tax=Actinia tenebrosa TaxID=6105 RepID=A0A6P8IF49_ACTTE|nr:polycomb group protein Pc-like [Actinia tenebrosa]